MGNRDRETLEELTINRDEIDGASAILEAGWRPPGRVINDVDELDALPPGSVVLDVGYEAWQLNGQYLWVTAGHPWPLYSSILHKTYGPCVVVWIPNPTPKEES